MNKEELLEEAKRRYPVGTQFVSVGNLMVATASVDPWFSGDNMISVRGYRDGGVCWMDGKWSKVVDVKQYTKEQVIEFGEWLKEQHILICKTGNGHQWASSYMGGGYFTTTELFDLWVKSKQETK